jgi:hypothetical protein
MSDSAFSVTFVDHERGLYVTARSNFTLIFEDGKASSYDEPVVLEGAYGRWQARLPGGLELDFERFMHPVELGGMRAHLCAAGPSGMGVVAEIQDPPRWRELDATRYICALFDRENAIVAYARRPTGSLGHGEELVIAHLWSGGELKGVENARLSTI